MSIILSSIDLIRHRIFITENLNAIKCLTSINNIHRDSISIARIINMLGDELKIYSKVGKELYSQHSFKVNDAKLKELFRELLDDNDSVVALYEQFRMKYDTRKKICSNITVFKKDSQRIIKQLEQALIRKNVIDVSYF